MKTIIIAALALAASGFCASPAEPVNQISLLHGCPGTSFEGKTAVAIATPTYTGTGTAQFLIGSDDPMYSATLETARESVLSGKNVVIDFPTQGAAFDYQVNGSVSCVLSGFYKVTSFTLQRN